MGHKDDALRYTDSSRVLVIFQVAELERKMVCARRQLVFSLACNIMRRRFKEAGMERADDMAPTLESSAVDPEDNRGETCRDFPVLYIFDKN